jgi:hypothetical protein
MRSRAEVFRKLEGVERFSDFYKLQGRLRQLRDIENFSFYLEHQIKEYEKQEELENLKQKMKGAR